MTAIFKTPGHSRERWMSKPDFPKKGKVNTLCLSAVTLSFATAQEAVSCRRKQSKWTMRQHFAGFVHVH